MNLLLIGALAFMYGMATSKQVAAEKQLEEKDRQEQQLILEGKESKNANKKPDRSPAKVPAK